MFFSLQWFLPSNLAGPDGDETATFSISRVWWHPIMVRVQHLAGSSVGGMVGFSRSDKCFSTKEYNLGKPHKKTYCTF